MPLSAPGKLITNFMKVNHLGLKHHESYHEGISITFSATTVNTKRLKI